MLRVDGGLLFLQERNFRVINVIYEEDIKLIKEIKVLDAQEGD